MALTPGSRIGLYQVTAPIGSGGMGQVWRATDTTLGRQVAIKILPDAFASDSERLARFEREAKTLASLNHPYIAAIYGFEKSGGVHALVMELVEGEDLSQRIASGAIPLEDALPIARQIADALEAAHGQNVIHRDLKPANIKVRPDGTVKVLDFGLAKAMDPTGALSGSASMAATITTPAMTQAGVILGTAAYMSPEQSRGKVVDARTDVWAFGAVLYEMLAGRRAFVGDDVTDTLAAVVLREPDWNALPADTPPGIRRVLARCLRKDSKQRLHHVADARIELDEPAAEAATAAVAAPMARSWPRLAAGAAVLLAVAAVALVQTVRLSRAGAAPSSPVRFTIAPPTGVESLGAGVPLAVLSPDGSRVVQSLRRGPVVQLFMRRLDEDDATGPPAPVLADVAVDNPNGLAQFSVSSTGTLAYVSQSAANPPQRLAWVDRTGRLSPIGQERRVFSAPRLSPDGRRLAVTIRDERDADVWVYDLARGTFGRVTSAPATQSDPVWTPDGRRLFFLFEEPVFHIYSRLADGGPEPERILDGPSDLTPSSVSPDGGILVYERNDPATRRGIWLLPLAGERKPRAFVDTPAEERDGIVSPDGRWLAYRSDETGRDEVYLQSFPDGPDRVQVSTNGGEWARWSRDGKEIFFREGEKLMAASVRGDVGRPVTLFERAWDGYDVAPDGRFIAIVPDENTPPTSAHVVLNWFEELRRLVPTR